MDGGGGGVSEGRPLGRLKVWMVVVVVLVRGGP